MLGKLGSFHLIAGNIDSSLYYFRIAETYTDTMTDPVWHSSALNNLGMACNAAGKRDSAYMHYNASIFELNNKSEDHQSLLGSITDNLAEWHEDNGEMHLAEQRHEENIERFKRLKDTLHLAHAFLGVSRTKWALDRNTVAFQYLDSAYQLLVTYSQEQPRKAGMMVDQFHLRSKLFRDVGNYEGALRSADSALAWEKQHNELNGEALMAMFSVLKESEVARVRRERSLRKDLLDSKDIAHNRLILLIVSIIVAIAVGISFAVRKG
jgi:tetratricopeptide (TPR) repeat protein